MEEPELIAADILLTKMQNFLNNTSRELVKLLCVSIQSTFFFLPFRTPSTIQTVPFIQVIQEEQKVQGKPGLYISEEHEIGIFWLKCANSVNCQ